MSNYEEILKAGNVSVCLQIKGVLVKSPAKGQFVELHATEVVVLGSCDAKTFPLAKKRHTLEHLRDIAHLRSRTNTVGIRSGMNSRSLPLRESATAVRSPPTCSSSSVDSSTSTRPSLQARTAKVRARCSR